MEKQLPPGCVSGAEAAAMMEAGEPPSQPPMETQQAEPYAGVAVPVNEMQPVAPVPYTGAPLAPVQVVAQESLPLPTMQAYAHPTGSIMHVRLADGRVLAVNAVSYTHLTLPTKRIV